MFKLNKTEAKIIVLLSSLDRENRNPYFLCAKLGKSYSTLYNYLRILIAKEYVLKVKTGIRTSYLVRNEEVLIEAKEVIIKNEANESNVDSRV